MNQGTQIVKALAQAGTKRIDIIAALGRDMSESEQTMFTMHKPVAMTGVERGIKHRDSKRIVELPAVESMDRRLTLEADPAAWLLHYMAAAYPYPFSSGHLDLIANTMHAAETGTGTATAQPRGEGKTTVMRGCGVQLTVRRVVKFPVLAGWKHIDAAAAIKMWLHMLTNCPEFAADYPEYCAPFLVSTHKTALANLVWADDVPIFGGQKTGALVETMDKVITLPNSMGAIAARSVQGDAKGLQAQMLDGSILRPDFLLFDDAQDPKQAGNPVFVEKTVDVIENVFMGMAGPQKRIVPAFACTVEAEEDVSCYVLNKKDFKTNRISRVKEWPDGSTGGTWESENDCKIRAMWETWRNVYLDDGQEACNEFFKANRKMMTGKMVTSWVHRFDPTKDVCDIDAAMSEWYKLGEDVFSRAQQNNPIQRGIDLYTLNADIVKSRVSNRKPFELPEWSEFICASTDINPSYALTSTIVSFGKDQSSAVPWFGLYKDAPLPIANECSGPQFHQLLFTALMNHGRQIAAMPIKPTHWMIDASGKQSIPVKRFAKEASRELGMVIIPAYGKSGKNARFTTNRKKQRAGEEWALCRDKGEQWVDWHADYWREIAQRSFTCDTGAPGGCTLPKGVSLNDFAKQICKRKLHAKGLLKDVMVWIWKETPGKDDYNDSMNMAFVCASVFANIGTGGFIEKRKPRKVFKSSDWSR